MATATDRFRPSTEMNADFFQVQRNAHRVFQGFNKLLEPLSTLPWGYDPMKSSLPEPVADKRKIWPFKKVWSWPRPRTPFTFSNQLARTLLTSWINIGLICVPIGLCLRYSLGKSASTFTFNYIAEFPLWFMTSDLLDIFTTNTVQVISAILLLRANKVSILQTYLVGSILCNILFLLGLSYFLGGLKNHVQSFNRTGAQGSSSLLSIAATSLLVPTSVQLLRQTTPRDLILQSRGVAIILLIIYFSYIWALMRTHRSEYQVREPELGHRHEPASSHRPESDAIELRSQSETRADPGDTGGFQPEENAEPPQQTPAPSKVVEITGVHLHFGVALCTFMASVVGLYFCIDATVESISALTERITLSQMFVALVLLPIPNCDFAPISLAIDDLVEQTMKYTVGRSIQTALLVEPLAILFSWWTHIEGVTLAFEGFEVVSLLTTILLLNFLIIPARVHWVHGILLLADFALIAVAAYFVRRPNSGLDQ